MVSNHNMAWVAGILEGEGCFYLNKKANAPVCRVQVLMSDEDVINKLAETTGCGSVYRLTKKPNRKQVWGWTVAKQLDVHDILLRVKPYMMARRRAKLDELLQELHKKEAIKELYE